MRRTKYINSGVARTSFASWMAILAMLLQVFFATVHATATAIAASAPPQSERSSETPFGIFQICTAAGIQQIGDKPTGTGGQKDNTVSSSCPICNSASVSPAINAKAVDCLSSDRLSMAMPVPPVSLPHTLSLQRTNPIRGPPYFTIN